MKDFAEEFKKITGKPLSKNIADYASVQEVDESIFEAVSRLFYEEREGFYYLKRKIEETIKKNKHYLLLSIAGYFSYVDCDFGKAIKCFKRSIQLNPEDLESWFCLAFCYRQIGRERKFNSIILDYDRIIRKFIEGEKDIEKLLR